MSCILFPMKNTRLPLIVSFIFFLQLLFVSGIAQNSPGLYNQKIFIDPGIKENITLQSIDDLKIYLQKATGKEFSVAPVQTPSRAAGIYIFLNKPSLVSPDLQKKLIDGSIEDFVISADAQHIYLAASHPLGLSRAIYTYLDKLGFRWYFPGDKWSYTPRLNNITINVKQYGAPSFHLRNFTGTGGMAHVKSIDPDFTIQKNWDDWKRRNRMGGEVELAGHYGDTFNYKYQAELQKHPEYLALVNGKRTSWHPDAKWCISNIALRKLFIQDRVQEGKETLAKTVFLNKKITISVDPPDGYGDCECEDCKRMGSYSDRIFFLSNEVAKELVKISPRLYANVYAYSTHAAPPPFSLAANLIVQVIPYVYQTVSSPQQLIKKWRTVHSNLFIYDYYGIADWSYNLPLPPAHSDDALLKKLKYWKAEGLQGFMLESSFSIGGTGFGLYLAGRLGWDIKENIQKERSDFYKNMFGKASSTMQKYFDKISLGFTGAADVPYLIDLVSKAKATVNGPERNRITDLQAYLHYVSLYYRFQSLSPEKKAQAWEELVTYVWQIYPSAILHSTRISELFISNFPVNNSYSQGWNPYDANPEKIKRTPFLSDSELNTLLVKDSKNNPLLEDFLYQKENNTGQYILNTSPKKEKIPEGMMLLDFPEIYIRSGINGIAHFWVKVNESSENNISQVLTIECTDTSTNAIIHTRQVSVDKQWKEIKLKLPVNKSYKLFINKSNWIRFYAPPDQWIAFKNIPTYTVMDTLWFYVPKGKKYIYYSNGHSGQPVFADAWGKPSQPEKVNDQNMFRVTIPFAASGQWWTISSNEYKSLQFYNKPDLFFMHPNYTYKYSQQ